MSKLMILVVRSALTSSARVSMAVACLLAAVAPSHASFATLWTERIAYPNYYNETRAVAVDASRNVVTTWRTGQVEGDPPFESLRYRGLGLARIDRDGGLRWARSFSSNDVVLGIDIATDPLENVLVCGYFAGQVDYYGGVPVDSVAVKSALVVKIDSFGILMWHRAIVGSGESSADAIAVDDDGGMIVVGSFSGTVDFGGGPVASAGGSDVFVTRLQSNGAHAWTRTFGSAQQQLALDVVIEADHEIVVLGEFEGSIDLGGGVHTSAGLRDIFFARFDADGNHQMSGAFGSASNEVAYNVAVGADGEPVLTGQLGAPVDLGGGPLSAGSFIAKRDAAGNHRWSKTTAYVWRNGLAVGPGDDVYRLDTPGIVVDDADGNFAAQESIDPFESYSVAIAVDPQWHVAVAGMAIKGESNFGQLREVVVRKLVLDQPNTVAITHFDAEWNGEAVALHAAFRSDLSIEAVNVYRGRGDEMPRRIDYVAGFATSFEYVDDDVVAGESYRYQIGVIDADGEFFSPTATVQTRALPTALGQNQPNPFNPSTRIPFTTSERGHVALAIYDATGRRVRALIDGTMPAGRHDVEWDGRDDRGISRSSGVYFCRMQAGKQDVSRKMILLK